MKSAFLELAPAIRKVHKGVSQFGIGVVLGGVPKDEPPRSAMRPSVVLTPRQTEILKLIAEGHTTAETAAKLGISVKTAETHRLQLMERLTIHRVADLVRYAIRIGLVSADA